MLYSDKWLRRLSWIINQITPSKIGDINESDLSRQINRNKINLIKHWDINCCHSVKTYQHKLQDYLRPNEKFVVTADKIIHGLRLKYDYIVGVHARRGDYAAYLDGYTIIPGTLI